MDVVVVVTEYDEDEGTVVDIGDETDDDNSAGCWCWGRERKRKEFQPRRCSGFRRHVRQVRRGASISFLSCGCWGVKTVSITNVRCGYQVDDDSRWHVVAARLWQVVPYGSVE